MRTATTVMLGCRSRSNVVRLIVAAACALGLSILSSAWQVRAQALPPAPATPPPPAKREPPDRGLIGVMRRDGLLVPFAVFKGLRWEAPWPSTTHNEDLPVDVAGIPDGWWGGEAPGPLVVHLADGRTASINLRNPRVYRSFCQTRIGLLTDYTSADPLPMPPPNPYPKDGLVMPAGIEVEPIVSISRDAPETLELARTMAATFDKAEDKTVAMIRSADRWRHPVKPEARHARPVTIEAFYRAPMDEPGWTAAYIEARRAYPSGLIKGDEGCGLETIFTGWVHTNTNDPKKSRLEISARVTYCDRVGVKYMLPLGRFHIRGQQYWAFQFSSFGDEWYEIARMAPANLNFVVESYGGGTRGCALPGMSGR